jgi:hypothetical protein
MSFLKFVSMLETHSLWFPRPYTFDDPWDGHYPPSYLKRMRKVVGADETLDRDFEIRFKRRRYGFFVNCWQQGEHECLAMWKLYGAAPEGVAIKSTPQDAKYCLNADRSGAVKYYDPKDDIRHENVISDIDDICYKRSYFQFEREWRMWRYDDDTLDRLDDSKPEFDVTHLSRGESYGIEDMKKLIHKLVIAPAASDLFLRVHRKITSGFVNGGYAGGEASNPSR